MATVSRGEITITNVNDGNTGKDGVSFTGITSYYLVSANSTGIKTDTSGWSTTPPITTTTNKYLWNYDKINYSDGTSTNSTPMIIGTHGATGNSGTDATAYWVTPSVNVIKKSASGTLSPTTILFSGYAKTGTANTVSYAGRFIISTSTDGITYTNVYTSASNQSTYTYTIPTTAKFIKVRMYLAGGTSVLLDEQTIPILESAEDLEIGGRNLLTRSAEADRTDYNTNNGTTVPITKTNMTEGTRNFVRIQRSNPTGSTSSISLFNTIQWSKLSEDIREKGAVTVSFLARAQTDVEMSLMAYSYAPNLPAPSHGSTVQLTNQWKRYSVTFDNIPSTAQTGLRVALSQNKTTIDNATFYIDTCEYMVEYATKPSNWSPAPEDAQLYTAWSNDPNGKDMVRVYPNENKVKQSSFTKLGFNQSGDFGAGTSNTTGVYIPVKKGEIYTVNDFDTVHDRFRAGMSANEPVLGGLITWLEGQKTRNTPFTITIPNDGFLVVQLSTTGTGFPSEGKVKIELGSTATVYTPNPQDDPVKAEMAYIGYSPKDSNDPKDYVWSENPKAKGTFKRWANDPNGLVDMTAEYPSENTFNSQTSMTTLVDGVNGVRDEVNAPRGFKFTGAKGGTGSFRVNNVIKGNGEWTVSFKVRGSQSTSVYFSLDICDSPVQKFYTTADNTWKEISMTVNVANWTEDAINFVDFSNIGWAYFFVSDFKVSKGKKNIYTTSPLDDPLNAVPQYIGIGSKDTMNPADFVWTVSPEYTQARTDLGLDEKADQKDLDDVRDTADHANNLGENAVQQNEFYSWLEDDYTKQIDEMKSISEQSQADLQNIDGRTALIESNLGNMSEKWNFIDTSITMAEEGILISDKADKMSILVSSGRIVFFDNEVEVAYITSQMLNISRGVFLESATIGNHVITKYSNTSPVTIIRYVGDVI